MHKLLPWLAVFGLLLACDRPVAEETSAESTTEAPAADAPAAAPRIGPAAGTAEAPATMPKTADELVAEANAVVTTVSPDEAMEWLGSEDVVFVDLRESEERDETGWIPNAAHMPRGMLEFYIDSSRPDRREVFHSGRRIVFYCAAGGRSALAARTAMEMGLEDVVHIDGGLRAWSAAGGPVAGVRQ